MFLPAFFVKYSNSLHIEKRIDEVFDVQIITMLTECRVRTATNFGTKINYILTYTMYNKH